MKKAGKKAKKATGQTKQPRGAKASKQPARVDSGSAAREDTGSSDARSADSSATILTSSNPRELERAVWNTPSTTTSAAAIAAGVKGVQNDEELLCALCHRKVHGNRRRRRNRSPSVDIRHGHQESSASNWKVLFWPAAIIILAIAVVSGIYMTIGVRIADNSEQRDDVEHEQAAFPEILCPCNTSHPTATTTGRAFTGQPVESKDLLLRRRRRLTAATVRGRRRHGVENTDVHGGANNWPKSRKTKRRGRQDPSHKGSLTSEKKLRGATTQGHVGHRIAPAIRRPSTETTLATALHTASSQLRTVTKRNALTTLGVSGTTTSRSGRQSLKSALKSSPIPRGTEYEKESVEDPFPETRIGQDADADWEVEKPVGGKNDVKRRRAVTRTHVGVAAEEVGAQNAASAVMHKRKRGVSNNLAAVPVL